MMLARKCKRLLAMLLAMVMCLGLVSTSALAAVEKVMIHGFDGEGDVTITVDNIDYIGTADGEKIEFEDSALMAVDLTAYNPISFMCGETTGTITLEKHGNGNEQGEGTNQYWVTEKIENASSVQVSYEFVGENMPEGVNAPASQEVVANKSFDLAEVAEVEGWTFSGWYLSNECTGDPVTGSYSVSEDTVFYGKWMANESEPDDSLTANEYHFMDISKFEQYCLQKLGVHDLNDVWGIDVWNISIYDQEGNQAWITTVNWPQDHYNVDALSNNGKYIQKDEISRIAVTISWVEGILNIKSGVAEFEAKDFTYSDVFRPDFGILNVVEVYCEPQTENYAVVYDANGGQFELDGHVQDTATRYVSSGTVLDEESSPVPTCDGNNFVGWYADEDCTTAFDFAQPITEDTILYAKWEPISGGTGESSYVRFYIEGLKNAEYNLTGIPGTGSLKVEKGFVYLESVQVENLEGGQTVATVADWMAQYNIKISSGYDSVAELVNAANKQEGNDLNATQYASYEYSSASWVSSDNAYHVHIKLNEKSSETGTLYIKKSVAGLPGDPGVPADYDVTITVTNNADGTAYTLTGLEDNDSDTITANNSEWGEIPGGTYFYWKLENIPAGQYTVKETEYSNDFVIGEKTYGLNKTEMTDNGNVTVAADGESWVAVTNTYGFKDDDGEPVGPNPTEKLYFSKRVNTISAKVGDELTYTIQVHNDSSQAATVTISDPLAAGLTYVSNNAGAAYDETTNTVSWTGEVDSGKTFELVIVAKINDDQADKTISNEAYVNQAKTNLVFTEVKAVDPDPTPTPTTTPTPTPTPTPTTPPTTPGGDGDGDDDIIVTVNPRPTPSEEPGIDIPEETTPLGPNPEPSEEPGIDIPEETTPLGPGPDDGSGDEDGTDIDLPDGETPLGNLPQTGAVAAPVNPAVTMGLMALAFSMAGCGLYFTFGRKKGEEED